MTDQPQHESTDQAPEPSEAGGGGDTGWRWERVEEFAAQREACNAELQAIQKQVMETLTQASGASLLARLPAATRAQIPHALRAQLKPPMEAKPGALLAKLRADSAALTARYREVGEALQAEVDALVKASGQERAALAPRLEQALRSAGADEGQASEVARLLLRDPEARAKADAQVAQARERMEALRSKMRGLGFGSD